MSTQQGLCHAHPPALPRVSAASHFLALERLCLWGAGHSLPLCFQGHSRTLPPTPIPAFPVRQPGVSFLLNRDSGQWDLLQQWVDCMLPTARASVAEVVRITQETNVLTSHSYGAEEVPHDDAWPWPWATGRW